MTASIYPFLLFILLGGVSACQAQPNHTMSDKNTANPLLCDPEKGICEIPSANPSTTDARVSTGSKAVKIIYFTDPICSSCWGIEPQLRRLKLEYGADIDVEYHMGGLLPDWSYNSGGISKPSDVAHHWDEVSRYYQMPIDGNVWLEDPLDSSYPPSIAFKAAELQDHEKALKFLRILREKVFLEKKNIAKWEHIAAAALAAGLDVEALKKDYESSAKADFQKDLELARQLGVRGFPTLFVTNAAGKQATVYGFRPYADFENAIRRVYPEIPKANYVNDWQSLFATYSTLTTREFAELRDISLPVAAEQLEALVRANKILKVDTRNGAIWIRK